MKSLIRSKRAVIIDGMLKGFAGWVTAEEQDTVELTLNCGTTVTLPRKGIEWINEWTHEKGPSSIEDALHLLWFGSERDLLRHRETIAQLFLENPSNSTNRQEIRQKSRTGAYLQGPTQDEIKDILTCPSCEKQATFADWYKQSSDDLAICPHCTGAIGYQEFEKKEQETAHRLKTG